MRALYVCVLCLALSAANASQWVGKVIYLKAQTNSKTVFFKLSGDIDSPARCNENLAYAIDLQAPGGKRVFDLITSAYIHRLTVDAKSLHTCDLYRKSEGVKEVVLKP